MEDISWKDGFPEKQGYYEVLIDGHKEDVARYFHCELKMTNEWVARDGSYIRGHDVKWFGEPMKSP